MSVREFTIDRISGGFALAFSLTALLTIVIAYVQPPPPTPPTDKGTLAHIFQLAVVLFVPALLTLRDHGGLAPPSRERRARRRLLLRPDHRFVGQYVGEHGYWYPVRG
jgi:hypothetical protein